jgi:hypothetical protein
VPETISQARLQQANALLAATTSACTVLGPVVAGVMVATMGPGGRSRPTRSRSS